MASWKTGGTRISETSKWYPRKYQFHYEDRGERSLALSRCPGNQKIGWHTWSHSMQETYTCRILPPLQVWARPSTLVRRSRQLCDAERLREELQHLKQVFRQNGYSHSDIRRVIRQNWNRSWKTKSPQVQPRYNFITQSAIKTVDFWRNVISELFTYQKGKPHRCWGLQRMD